MRSISRTTICPPEPAPTTSVSRPLRRRAARDGRSATSRPTIRAPNASRRQIRKSITTTERGMSAENGCATVNTTMSTALATATARRIIGKSRR